ncbi:MAG: hypothetical protein PWP65_996 [Clostridia bacterium]|nr:hypothetical protein [Clostridia bacterium]
MSRNLRLLLVDRHTLIRKGLLLLMSQWEGIEVVGEAEDGEKALELALKLRPDIVLMDVNLPRLDGLKTTRRLKEAIPEIKIIILTLNDDLDTLRAAIDAGAEGYLLKTVEPQQLYFILQEVARGEMPISAALTRKLLQDISNTHSGSILSHREKEILRLVARGLTNQEIAHCLYLSENTVKNHLRNIMEKLHTKNRLQAAHYARQIGLID